MKKQIYKDKFYTHLDRKKYHTDYQQRVQNINWVSRHGFYPFIHFQMDCSKYTNDSEGNKYIKEKNRDIYYAAHIDRFIYEYYGNRLNDKYNNYMKMKGINRVSTAYRNCTPGKCNIDFAKEVFEYIVRCETAYIFVGDFSKFFDNLDHGYLKEKIKCVNGQQSLDSADYAIYKNITKFAYVEADDIESEKGLFRRDMRELDKYFETDEFHEFKKKHLHKNCKDYQIPQGSSISAVYANIYMIDFDKKINDFITSQKGIYRRYCDDIIIVVPITYSELQNKKNEKITKFIYDVRDSIPNLELNEDKTEHFFYDNGVIKKLKGHSSLINYLGFTFDGKIVRIRDKSLFKFYCRAYRKIKKVKENTEEKAFNAGRKAIYHSYTHLGSSRYAKDHGNFLTYAYKADEIFSQSQLLESAIRNQVKKHWYKIDNKLKNDIKVK